MGLQEEWLLLLNPNSLPRLLSNQPAATMTTTRTSTPHRTHLSPHRLRTLFPNPSRTLPPPPTPTPSSTPTTPLTGTSGSTSTELASEATPEPTTRVLYLLAPTALGSTPSSTPSTTPTVTPKPSSLPPPKLQGTSSLLENWRSTGSRTGLTSILPHSK